MMVVLLTMTVVVAVRVVVLVLVILMLDFLHLDEIDSSRFKLVLEPLLFEVLADNDEKTLALLVLFPLDVWLAGEQHSNTVEDELIWAVLNGDEALHAVNVLTFFLQDSAEELVHRVHRHLGLHAVREGSDAGVVLVGRHVLVLKDFVVDFKRAFDAEHIEVEDLREWIRLVGELDLLDRRCPIVLANFCLRGVKRLTVT